MKPNGGISGAATLVQPFRDAPARLTHPGPGTTRGPRLLDAKDAATYLGVSP